MQKSLEATTRLIHGLDRCMSASEVCAEIGRSTSDFGVEYMFAGTMPPPRAPRREQVRHVMLGNLPPEWAHRYFAHRWLDRDPTIERVRSLAPAFRWSDLPDREDPVMCQASDHGLKDGLTFSLLTLESECAGFSFAGERIDDSPEARAILGLVSSFAVGRCLALREGSEDPERLPLSPREAETLRWIAEGKTDWEISTILGVSEKTVQKFVRDARLKLGAINRAHALSVAFRAGVLS